MSSETPCGRELSGAIAGLTSRRARGRTSEDDEINRWNSTRRYASVQRRYTNVRVNLCQRVDGLKQDVGELLLNACVRIDGSTLCGTRSDDDIHLCLSADACDLDRTV